MKQTAVHIATTVAALALFAAGAVAQDKPAAPAIEAPANQPPAIEAPASDSKPAASKPSVTPTEATPADRRFALGHTVKTIDGQDANLADYKGQVVMIVNVASQCGLTPQYEGLEKLFETKKSKGFVILGFPANNFGGQEPGSNDEIAQFCKSKYNVTFPMFAKLSVKGTDQHPLYKQLCGQPAPIGGNPKWNFTKFLIDRDGNVVARFDSGTKPDDKQLVAKVDELLGKDAAKPAGAPAKPADSKPGTTQPVPDKK